MIIVLCNVHFTYHFQLFLPTPSLNSPIPPQQLPSTPLPPSSLPISSSLPPNLGTVMASLSKPGPTTSHSKTKDGLIRMLLQSHPLAPQSPGPASPPATPDRTVPDTPDSPYLARLCGNERLLSLISLDHSYSKPWNWKPECSLLQPTRTMFVPRVSRNIGSQEPEDPAELFVDVVSEPARPQLAYDKDTASKVMDECDRFLDFARPGDTVEEEEIGGWEERLPRESWSPAQAKLFSKMLRVLGQDRLARLAQAGHLQEPVLRRISVDRSCRRARAALASPPCTWDRGLVQWLHQTLTAHLPRPLLSAWLDILQTLRSKVPQLLDRLLAAPVGRHLDPRSRTVAQEGLAMLLRRPWDPAAATIARRRLARLPSNPVLVVAPPGPADNTPMSRRLRQWNNQLGCLGKVIVINMPTPRGEVAAKTLVNYYLHQMVSATLNKVREIRSASPERPLVLLGWGVGAAIAAHVAGIEKLGGLVCLGFPVTTLTGPRGGAGDTLLELKTPVLFVVGEKAAQTDSDDVEDIREVSFAILTMICTEL